MQFDYQVGSGLLSLFFASHVGVEGGGESGRADMKGQFNFLGDF